jgi:hypothetical protein
MGSATYILLQNYIIFLYIQYVDIDKITKLFNYILKYVISMYIFKIFFI